LIHGTAIVELDPHRDAAPATAEIQAPQERGRAL
jgi:hypothetical protein